MTKLTEKLFWEKYRPRLLKQMILIPRIHRLIKDGVHLNFIFYGSSGTGKSTLANILSSDYNALKLNGKLHVDVLRTKIENHCSKLSFIDKGFRIIYLDEFDRASAQLQEELKSFMETYEHNTRFIFTTNHIDKIDDELKSRFVEVCFDPMNSEERKFLYDNQIKYLRAVSKAEKMDMYKETEPYKKILNKHFPDLRKAVEEVQVIKITGDNSLIGSEYGSDRLGLYKFVLDGDINPMLNYDYVMNNYFTNFDDAFKHLSRPFFEYLKEYHPDIAMSKGGKIFDVQKEYNSEMTITMDPITHLINYILHLKDAIKG